MAETGLFLSGKIRDRIRLTDLQFFYERLLYAGVCFLWRFLLLGRQEAEGLYFFRPDKLPYKEVVLK